jgi:hypothetical protein
MVALVVMVALGLTVASAPDSAEVFRFFSLGTAFLGMVALGAMVAPVPDLTDVLFFLF